MPPKRVSKSQRKGGKSSFSKDDLGGIDPELMLSIVNKIPPNPVTGQVDLSDIINYMSQNPSQMEDVMAQMNTMGLDDSIEDLSKFNYTSLASNIVHESFWVVQLENMGMVDKSGNVVDPADIEKSPAGLRPSFIIYVYDDKGSYRVTHDCIGLPDSKTVLQAIQRAIAKPLPPLKPSLPWFLMVSIKFKQHTKVLKPFLDSLPKPFHWRYETVEEAEGLKNKGNAAFSRRDRAAAMDAYTEATHCLHVALSLNLDADEEKIAERQLAICYANRAACRLLQGNGIDIRGALEDGEQAEKMDPVITNPSAYQAMGKMDEAQDVIVRALLRPDLENDAGLVDRLIDLQTGGKGLSNDEAVFKNWVLDALINNEKSRDRVAELKGEWSRRCDAHFAKFKR
ncbi:hypothetical protein BDQ17DRAFT_1421550 [Cyathus striatus]|nr:hypothetical protein BDQ17DRAFT_1421550 [Cyathus striatus]